MDREEVAREIVDSALKVHSRLGPGLLEVAYQACLSYELTRRGLAVRQQVPIAIEYDDVRLDVGYRMDLLVGECVVVELKAAEKILPVHAAQLLTYLRLGHFSLGLLLNFNVGRMRDGIRRVINQF